MTFAQFLHDATFLQWVGMILVAGALSPKVKLGRGKGRE